MKKTRSFAMVAVFIGLTLGNVACLKAKPERAKPKSGPAGTTIAGGAGSQLKTTLAPGQVQAPCDAAVKAFNASVEDIVKLETAKRTVDSTLVAFEIALSTLNDATVTLAVSGSLSSDQKVKEESNNCTRKREEAIGVAFARKELYDVISAAVSAKAPGDEEKRLADVILRKMEEKGAAGGELKDKLAQLKTLEDKYTANVRGVTIFLSSIAESDARKTEYMKRKTRGAAENAKILPDLLRLRSDIASLRKKKSWADLKASEGMPKDAVTVSRRLLDIQEVLVKRLADQKAVLAKYAAEHSELKLKDVNPWDVDFLADKVFPEAAASKEGYDREPVLVGLNQAFAATFGIKIDLVKDEKPILEGIHHFSIANDKTVFANFYVYLGASSAGDTSASEGATPGKLRVLMLSTAHSAGKAQGASAVLTGSLATKLQLSDIEELIREMGKLFQHLLYTGKYASLSAHAENQDFRDIAPNVFENWLLEPTILALFAKVPSEKALNLAKLRVFKATYELAEELYGARVDLEVHGEGSKGDLPGIAERVFNDVYGVKLEQPASAIFGLNGRLWGKILSEAYAADVSSKFAGNPMDPGVGKRFRDMLAKGAAADAETLVHDFLGRDPAPGPALEALLKR